MPELTGQRKYGGVYTLPTIKDDTISDKAKQALEWLVSYGLWGDDEFDEEATVDEAFMETVLKRFYTYFGTEEKDDFFAAVNHDFLYEESDDAIVTPDVDYKKSLMLNSMNVQANVISYANSLIKGGDPDAALYQEALDYYAGTLDYSFLDDPLIKTQISFIRSIDSLSGCLQYATNAFSLFGESILGCFYQPSYQYDENMNVVTAIFVGSTTASFNLDNATYSSEETIATATKAFSSMGLSGEELTSWAKSFSDFGLRFYNEYQDDKYEGKYGTHVPLYDLDANKDIFASNAIDIDLSSLFLSSGYTVNDLASLLTQDEADYLSYGRALLSATPEELRAISLYGLYNVNKEAIQYQKGSEGNYNTFMKMIENNLAAAYMESPYYESSLNAMNDLFAGIKQVFSKRIISSSWLSENGKTAVLEKIEAVKSTMIGSCSDGTTLDYQSLSIPSGFTLAASLGAANGTFQKELTHRVANGQVFDRTLLLSKRPFLSNAFYTPNSNTINMTFGAIFSLGIDISGVPEETILAKMGFVLGHEVTHGFDSRGVYFDKNGSYLKDGLIPQEDMDNFTALTLKVQALYKGQEALPGLSQDPAITITEDVADIGGFVFMEELGKKKASFDFKLFYHEAASGFGTKISRKYFISAHLNNVHPFGRVRCNVLLSNSPLFAKTFNLTPDDAMYVPSEEQVVIW